MTDAKIESEAIALVEQFLSCLDGWDLQGCYALFSEDCVYSNMPYQTLRGLGEIRHFLDMSAKGATGISIETLHIAASGGVVLTERVDTLTTPLGEVPLPIMGVFEVQGGEIVAWRDYFDWLNIFKLAGGSFARRALGPIGRFFG